MPKCNGCGNQITLLEMVGGVCPHCLARQSLAARGIDVDGEMAELQEDLSRIILTTETSHNLPVTDRLGIVTAECVLGMNLFRDIAASLRDVVGGRSQTMQRGLREARETALDDLRAQALDLGADAVVGIALDYSEISGGGKSMLFLVASGTAVRLAEDT